MRVSSPEVIFSNGYADRLNMLISAEFSPENIANYATDALDGLIGISTDMRLQQGLDQEQWTSQAEDAAFNAHGLGNIQQILKHITNLGDKIRRAAELAEKIRVVDDVFLPTDQQAVTRGSGAGAKTFEKGTVLRLQTVLFILDQDFSIDTADSAANNMEKGSTLKTMIRDDGYVYIDVPSLSRTILICDEAENASYVFDTNVIDQLQLDGQQLRTMSKTELANLIASLPEAGKRIVFSKDFTKDIKAALASTGGEATTAIGRQYLLPPADENIVSVNRMAKQLGIHTNTLIKLAQTKGIPVGSYAGVRAPIKGIDVSYYQSFRQDESVAVPSAAAYGARSLEELRFEVGLGREALADVCAANGIRVASYKFGARPREGVGIHGDDLDTLHALPELNVPDGEARGAINATRVLELLAPLQFATLVEVKEELDLELEEYRFGRTTAQGYLKEDFERIRQHEKVCTPEAYDYGAVSLAALAQQEDTSVSTVRDRVKRANVRVGKFKFNSTPGDGVIAEDVDDAVAALGIKLPGVKRRTRSPREPGEYVSVNQLRTRLDVTGDSVILAAGRAGIAPRDITVEGRITKGFTLQEADQIWQDEKMATPNAQEYDAISFKPLEDILNVTRGQLNSGMNAVGAQIGEYRFGPNYTRGILRSEIPRLKAYFEANNISR